MDVLLTETIDLERVADLCAVGLKRKPPTPRDYSKWHVSNLLQSANKIARGEIVYHEYEGHPLGIMSLGRIWESALDCYLADYAVSRGGVYIPDVEQEQDDVLGSLDGLMWLPELGWMVCETKLRFTLNGEIPLSHLQQVRTYCYLAKTDLVCYVSGHLSSRPPTARAEMRIIRLTQQSIEETWGMIVNTRDYLLGQGCCPARNGGVEQ